MDGQSWDRRPGEPAMWYERFELYRMAGPARAVLSVYRRYSGNPKGKAPPHGWSDAFHKWEWQRRAEEWDAAEQKKVREAFDEERRKDKEIRLQMLHAFRSRLAEALLLLDPRSANWRDVIGGLQTVNSELRIEYGEDPSQNMGPLDITLSWSDVPPELRRKDRNDDLLRPGNVPGVEEG
jgi:hypothetical protein